MKDADLARLEKTWDAAARATFGVLDEYKQRTDLYGILSCVDRITALIELRVGLAGTFATTHRAPPCEAPVAQEREGENGAAQGSVEEGGGGRG